MINNAYIPFEQELKWVLDQTTSRGWLQTMRQQLLELGLSDAPLVVPKPASWANVRFLPEEVFFFQPNTILKPPNKTTKINLYQPLDWDDGYQAPVPSSKTDLFPQYGKDDVPDRSEAERMRAAQPGSVYDPQHSILQNRLRRHLRSLYGPTSVKMEKGFVDLQVVNAGSTTFIEIKMERTVKGCIRQALGQLLEYAYYPAVKKADKLLVVGDKAASKDDELYLGHIRTLYGLPLYYAQWSWPENKLAPET